MSAVDGVPVGGLLSSPPLSLSSPSPPLQGVVAPQCSPHHSQHAHCRYYYQHVQLALLYGLPGSGKSCVARGLAAAAAGRGGDERWWCSGGVGGSNGESTSKMAMATDVTIVEADDALQAILLERFHSSSHRNGAGPSTAASTAAPINRLATSGGGQRGNSEVTDCSRSVSNGRGAGHTIGNSASGGGGDGASSAGRRGGGGAVPYETLSININNTTTARSGCHSDVIHTDVMEGTAAREEGGGAHGQANEQCVADVAHHQQQQHAFPIMAFFTPAAYQESRRLFVARVEEALLSSPQSSLPHHQHEEEHRRRHLVVAVDNMPYASMRRELWRLVRRLNGSGGSVLSSPLIISYSEVFLDIPLHVCLAQNEGRRGGGGGVAMVTAADVDESEEGMGRGGASAATLPPPPALQSPHHHHHYHHPSVLDPYVPPNVLVRMDECFDRGHHHTDEKRREVTTATATDGEVSNSSSAHINACAATAPLLRIKSLLLFDDGPLCEGGEEGTSSPPPPLSPASPPPSSPLPSSIAEGSLSTAVVGETPCRTATVTAIGAFLCRSFVPSPTAHVPLATPRPPSSSSSPPPSSSFAHELDIALRRTVASIMAQYQRQRGVVVHAPSASPLSSSPPPASEPNGNSSALTVVINPTAANTIGKLLAAEKKRLLSEARQTGVAAAVGSSGGGSGDSGADMSAIRDEACRVADELAVALHIIAATCV